MRTDHLFTTCSTSRQVVHKKRERKKNPYLFTTCSTSFTILYNLICVGKSAAIDWHWAQRSDMFPIWWICLSCCVALHWACQWVLRSYNKSTALAICYPYSTLLIFRHSLHLLLFYPDPLHFYLKWRVSS